MGLNLETEELLNTKFASHLELVHFGLKRNKLEKMTAWTNYARLLTIPNLEAVYFDIADFFRSSRDKMDLQDPPEFLHAALAAIKASHVKLLDNKELKTLLKKKTEGMLLFEFNQYC